MTILPRDLPGLLSLCRHRQPEQWAKRPKLYAQVGKRILERGEPLLAYDLFQEGLAATPKDSELLRLLALSLARSGAPGRACEILTGLYDRGRRDEETLGILARTHKDLAAMAATPQERAAERKLAYGFYLRSYRAERGYYAGINAAALALLLGRRAQARRLAREVREICLAKSPRRLGAGGEAYWIAATLGESALIMGDRPQAELWYARAARLGRGRYADISSTRRQARLILKSQGRETSFLERCFKIPRVVAFTGHRIDLPARGQPRFPASAEGAVRAAIAQRLQKLGAGFGYASAACGSDIIFLEEMLKRGGEIHIVLPCSPAEFRIESVDAAGRPGWGARFERLLRRAARVHVANDHGKAPGSLGFEYANLLLDGMARLRAASLDTDLVPLAVWDGEREEGVGGTGSLVRHWRGQGLTPEIIPLPGRRDPARRRKKEYPGPEPQRIKALLFADVVGYSRLREEQIPAFVREMGHDCLPATTQGIAHSGLGKPHDGNLEPDAAVFILDFQGPRIGQSPPIVRREGLARDFEELVEDRKRRLPKLGLVQYLPIGILPDGPLEHRVQGEGQPLGRYQCRIMGRV